MKELTAFIIVVAVTALIYIGVEPYAHSVMNPHVEPAQFNFVKADDEMKDESIKNFWSEVNAIDLSKGDAARGAEIIQMAGCTGCHGIKKAGIDNPMDPKTSVGGLSVAPADLSNIAYLYDEKFLAGLIKDPAKAMKLTHKFNDENPFEMPAFFGAGGDLNEEIADIVAYLKSIAPKTMSDDAVFKEACVRCHDMKYAKMYPAGNKKEISKYLGITPPDLSMYIRSRSTQYLNDFINDPQKMLAGTAMPRVGLKQSTQKQVLSFMSATGDSKKEERESLGYYLMGYFLILAIFATLWKRKIWEKLH